MKKCCDCVFSVHKDFGYSNYTTEGTEIYCSKNLNPQCPFDNFYGEDEKNKFAESCESFLEGEGVDLDTELEDITWGKENEPESWVHYETPHVSKETLCEMFKDA